MILMTHTPSLVTEQTIPAFGPYSATTISIDSALDQIVSSTAAISQAINGRSDPGSVADLISARLRAGSGATTGTLFVAHHKQLFAVSGVIAGVNEMVVHFADELNCLRIWPLASVIALIAD
ncbi:MAG: hypothetical protein DI630_00430 [Gordonia sp. (in: high G+C Gram-positive bacteria)]|nr:MAG: hypothetical protein DI630_00430 [Gordonia sp. (in: high G+C Gram-positive bacteria)]